MLVGPCRQQEEDSLDREQKPLGRHRFHSIDEYARHSRMTENEGGRSSYEVVNRQHRSLSNRILIQKSHLEFSYLPNAREVESF
jgi:hypothetical protein